MPQHNLRISTPSLRVYFRFLPTIADYFDFESEILSLFHSNTLGEFQFRERQNKLFYQIT